MIRKAMHITDIQIWKVKHRTCNGNEYIHWDHKLVIELPGDIDLTMYNKDTTTFISHPVDLRIEETEAEAILKDKLNVVLFFFDEDGHVDFTQTLKVHSITNLNPNTSVLSINVLLSGISKLVFVKGL